MEKGPLTIILDVQLTDGHGNDREPKEEIQHVRRKI
jgi:hypothetical protein